MKKTLISYEKKDSLEHNYLKKLQKMLKEGFEFPVGYNRIIIEHDKNCGIYDKKNGICNCNANIIFPIN